MTISSAHKRNVSYARRSVALKGLHSNQRVQHRILGKLKPTQGDTMRGHKQPPNLISKLTDEAVTRSATRSLISLAVFANLPASDQIALLEATLENGALQLLMHSQEHISKLFHYLSSEAQDHIIKDDRFNFLLERAHKSIVDVTNSDFPDYSSARPGTLYVKKHKPLYTLKRVLPPNNKTTPKPGKAIAKISEATKLKLSRSLNQHGEN